MCKTIQFFVVVHYIGQAEYLSRRAQLLSSEDVTGSPQVVAAANVVNVGSSGGARCH